MAPDGLLVVAEDMDMLVRAKSVYMEVGKASEGFVLCWKSRYVWPVIVLPKNSLSTRYLTGCRSI